MHTLVGELNPSGAMLQVRGLTAGYGPMMVIHGVSLAAHCGKVTAIVGPNGAGKSTALKAIVGEANMTAGMVALGSNVISGRRPDEIARAGVGYVPQVRDVFTKLTVQENLEVGGHHERKEQVRERIEEVFGIFPQLASMRSRRAGNLSGGERKMLAIARALMARPTVLLLDEPTANLSPKLAEMLLREHVGQLAARGAAILIVEQRAVEALAIADYAYLMVGGRVALELEASAMLARGDIGELFLGRAGTSTGNRGGAVPQVRPSQ